MHSTRPLSQFATEMRDWIRRAPEPDAPPLPFGDLARHLFALQFEHNAPYRRWCEARHATPASVTDWRQIPAAPAASFKELELTCLPAEEQVTEFHSSGTTARINSQALAGRADRMILSPSPQPSPAGRGGTASHLSANQAPILGAGAAMCLPLPAGEGWGEGERPTQSEPPPIAAAPHILYQPSRHLHSHESLALYEASLTAWFQPHLLPDWPTSERRASVPLATLGEQAPADFAHFLALSPSPALAPHSSLAHMFTTVQREFGHGAPRYFGTLDETGAWALDLPVLMAELDRACAEGLPVILLGTAFSFVHLLDALAKRDTALALPAGSRLMETGGYKGRSRELPKAELHRALTEHLGIPATHIVCEYGMSELSSQAYDSEPLRIADCGLRIFNFSPWARAVVVSPETGREVGDGETGLLRVFDLANVWSVLAIQTEDLAVRRGDGFELLGRAQTAEPRGCSLLATA